MATEPLLQKYASWSPYAYALDNPLKNTDPDGVQPMPLTPDKVGWWSRQFDDPMRSAQFREWRKNVAAPWVHRNVTLPLEENEKIYLSIGTAGYLAGNPVVTSFGYVGAQAADILGLMSLMVEERLAGDEQSQSKVAGKVVKIVVVNGVNYALACSPAGELAWFLADSAGKVIRQLNSEEVEEIGLKDDDQPAASTSGANDDTDNSGNKSSGRDVARYSGS